MGAWGTDSFQNDDALDWVTQLEESDDESAILDALDAVTESEDLVDAGDASAAIAAAEVVAAMAGKPAKRLPSEVTAWVKEHPGADEDLKAQARAAVDSILEDSELKDLWRDSEDFEQWQKAVESLKQRLS